MGKIPASRVRIPPSPLCARGRRPRVARFTGKTMFPPYSPFFFVAFSRLIVRLPPGQARLRRQPESHLVLKKQRIPCCLAAGLRGGVAERSNAAVSKTVSGGFVRRGFKSLPLRLVEPNPVSQAGFRLRACPYRDQAVGLPSLTGDSLRRTRLAPKSVLHCSVLNCSASFSDAEPAGGS